MPFLIFRPSGPWDFWDGLSVPFNVNPYYNFNLQFPPGYRGHSILSIFATSRLRLTVLRDIQDPGQLHYSSYCHLAGNIVALSLAVNAFFSEDVFVLDVGASKSGTVRVPFLAVRDHVAFKSAYTFPFNLYFYTSKVPFTLIVLFLSSFSFHTHLVVII